MARKSRAKSIMDVPRMLVAGPARSRRELAEAARKLREAEHRYQKGLSRIMTAAQRRAFQRLESFERRAFVKQQGIRTPALRVLKRDRVKAIREALAYLSLTQRPLPRDGR